MNFLRRAIKPSHFSSLPQRRPKPPPQSQFLQRPYCTSRRPDVERCEPGQNPRSLFAITVISGIAVATVYFSSREYVPYTKRSHLVLLPPPLERKLGEWSFNKSALRSKILPSSHPDSIRVRLIASGIIDALHRGLHQSELTWEREDEVLDGRSIREKRGARPATAHLKGLNWEVVVVGEKDVNAFCLPGGKIVVFTGLLDHFSSDAEIATIVGHEVGHVVARHAAEGMTKNLWIALLQMIALELFGSNRRDLIDALSKYALKLPFTRRMEIEADYIGLLLLASAGYDPRVAPKVFEKLGQLSGDSALGEYFATHPSSKTRAKLLSQPQVMDEALALYGESVAGRGAGEKLFLG